MRPTQWGILGTGFIAHAMADALKLLPEAELTAIGSRTQKAADAFGAEYGVPYCLEGYDAVCESPDVDVVYVATPHAFHARDAKTAIDAGKAVLCEKAFTVTAREANDVIRHARSRGVFLMEAMWTRFVPAVVKLREWIAAGSIGEIRHVAANIGWARTYDPANRLFARETAGGALLDIGVYPISFFSMLLGPPGEVAGVMTPTPNGVDRQCAGSFVYPSGALATFAASFASDLPCDVRITGTEGWIHVHPPIIAPQALTRSAKTGAQETVELPYLGNGYPHEATEVNHCLAQGKTESEIMPLDETLSIMQTMDALRDRWGLRYAADEKLTA
jgi:dihydrodiol dehydrogenase / D-xylose 1-dehydrogenase (NADP)